MRCRPQPDSSFLTPHLRGILEDLHEGRRAETGFADEAGGTIRASAISNSRQPDVAPT